MENFNQANIELDYTNKFGMNNITLKTLDNYLNKLNEVFKKENQNFADLCFYVYQVRALFYGNYCYDKKGNMLQFYSIMKQFGINESEQSRLCSCYDKYFEFVLSKDRMNIEKYKIKDIYFLFSKSKLFELLSVPNEQLEMDIKNKVLRADFSVKQIRDYVKNYKSMIKQQARLTEEIEEQDEEEFNEENIPMAYNPQQHYDFDYFEDKNKAQLLNIVWELQKEKEKLEEKYNKLKRSK